MTEVRFVPRRVTEDDLRAIDALLDEAAGAPLTAETTARLREIVTKGLKGAEPRRDSSRESTG